MPGSQQLPGGKETILLVDDEVVVLNSTRRMLETLGYSVLSADSGRQAIELAEENLRGIDVVLLDKRMPGFSGAQVFEPLQTILPDAKIIMISGKGFDADDAPLIEAGASTILEKPFRIGTLAPIMRAVIDEDK
jgi:two-component system, cell cycle sensor histidine kinase and response regulator CckA